MERFCFEATIGISPRDAEEATFDSVVKADAAAVARAVFAMGGARRVTVVSREEAAAGVPTVDHLELHAPWDDEGGSAWGLREDVERVAGEALRRS